MNPTPCPRCGKPPAIERIVETFVAFHVCAEIPEFTLELEGYFKSRDLAIGAWNEVVKSVKGNQDNLNTWAHGMNDAALLANRFAESEVSRDALTVRDLILNEKSKVIKKEE